MTFKNWNFKVTNLGYTLRLQKSKFLVNYKNVLKGDHSRNDDHELTKKKQLQQSFKLENSYPK